MMNRLPAFLASSFGWIVVLTIANSTSESIAQTPPLTFPRSYCAENIIHPSNCEFITKDLECEGFFEGKTKFYCANQHYSKTCFMNVKSFDACTVLDPLPEGCGNRLDCVDDSTMTDPGGNIINCTGTPYRCALSPAA